MIKYIQSIRGMHDYLPNEVESIKNIENIIKNIVINYGYSEIRLPIVEKTALFKRAIGNYTELIEKEMYTFKDRNGEQLTLRPEGTAGCIRSGIENGLFHNQEQRLWYLGPMFRHERPQKARYRQFYQLGLEVFGQKGPDTDAELILLINRIWKTLGISDEILLEINTIGSPQSRLQYCKVLIDFLKENKTYLDKQCYSYINTNPLRILDKITPHTKNIFEKKQIPLLRHYLDDSSKKHFSNLCNLLKISDITYRINPYLVRGLDYYTGTVFEWISKNKNITKTICAGGRYDNLVEKLGGKNTPAVGLAIGLDRLFLLLKEIKNKNFIIPSRIDAYLIYDGNHIQNIAKAIKISEEIRCYFPLIRIRMNHGGGSLKTQFHRANKCGARFALMLNELQQSDTIILKNLDTGQQEILSQSAILSRLQSLVNVNNI
ncbi:histidine--tRNA ligase [Candidatus Schneideria nysicola]|uniref:histidine--tRNA ligase n=1 Tax=Candidatus Schneideria nysicola TaxID=1081631 RepID=UPI001CAA57CB|nr:histidine--tRNA ligase [Candidatus Schneideria nysicola]UAJ64819.1 histidine--tRNA ligase [Candidatus Schneideria nysicola]